MKSKTIVFLLFLVAAGLGCKKKEDVTPDPAAPVSTGTLAVRVTNTVDGNPIVFGQLIYTNPFGSQYSVDLLKYYLTNLRLVAEDSSEYNLKNYDLINAADTTTCSFEASGVPNGTYKAIRFYIGVDRDSNHTGTQSGDLDPINGMIWTWNTGYIFFKHEGQFRDTAGAVQDLLYHFGTDPVLTEVTLPVTPFTIDGNRKTVRLQFDLNGLYGSQTIVDFNNNNIRQSLSVDDRMWMSDLITNFPGSFTVLGID